MRNNIFIIGWKFGAKKLAVDFTIIHQLGNNSSIKILIEKWTLKIRLGIITNLSWADQTNKSFAKITKLNNLEKKQINTK